ncbi:aminotransferase class V-fold PLP-dependent enzyme [Terrisporobacter mayombei]|uniref:Cysteine desulfurase SufS n=1 Tax=Terrisporobacter mayombei TaxID=1541 RepID=A0ABY9Q5E1_9FIRM|nr:aminotransferase class V-fold PLP-dependent enzyme [Terrisporobacter mayombei]MCC3869835.1 aminotransferase class V-fold PLP-dependent enzyme [Terrisporobacter mayombei]WMT83225.1 Cysteine desulfurase SufS [Terrisporobacter mayombei]
MDIYNKYRDLFVGVDKPVQLADGNMAMPIGFDNGATTPSLKSSYKALCEGLMTYGAVARGTGQKSEITTQKYEESRQIILDFFNVGDDSRYTAVFGKTTTECMNLLSNVLIKSKDDKILTTRMEHHANDLPWRYSATVEYVDVDKNGRISVDNIENKLREKNGTIKYVTVTGASNVTGYVNPIHEIAKICHKYNAKIIVDGAQLVAHKEINMKGENPGEEIDFLAFSSHKTYAPFGTGVIVGLKEDLSNATPFLKGGACVKAVTDYDVIWDEPPALHEAGSPNSLGAMATARALQELKQIGYDNIYKHEMMLKEFIITEMKKIDRVILYGDNENIDDRLGIIVFNIDGQNYKTMGKRFADEMGIALRTGKFCAHPYVNRLMGVSDETACNNAYNNRPTNGMLRASLGLYNTVEEARAFIAYIKYLVSTL